MPITEKEYDELSYEEQLHRCALAYKEIKYINKNKLFDIKKLNIEIEMEISEEGMKHLDSIQPNYIKDDKPDNVYTLNTDRIELTDKQRKLLGDFFESIYKPYKDY